VAVRAALTVVVLLAVGESLLAWAPDVLIGRIPR
jgi:hypothetical protein